MLLAEVVGNVVSTRKNEKLIGFKLLEVRVEGDFKPEKFVAIDNVGAGVGEKVLVVLGSAARQAVGENIPVDAVVVGIVDPV